DLVGATHDHARAVLLRGNRPPLRGRPGPGLPMGYRGGQHPDVKSQVEAGQGIVVDVSRWDDASLRIEYLGSDLYLHSGRFGYPADYDQFIAKFPAAPQSWLAAGCEEELPWVVEVELCLATRPPDSPAA